MEDDVVVVDAWHTARVRCGALDDPADALHLVVVSDGLLGALLRPGGEPGYGGIIRVMFDVEGATALRDMLSRWIERGRFDEEGE